MVDINDWYKLVRPQTSGQTGAMIDTKNKRRLHVPSTQSILSIDALEKALGQRGMAERGGVGGDRY